MQSILDDIENHRIISFIISCILIVVGLTQIWDTYYNGREPHVSVYGGCIVLISGIILLFWILGAFRMNADSKMYT